MKRFLVVLAMILGSFMVASPAHASVNLTVGSTWSPTEMATRQPTEPFVEISRVFFSGTTCPNLGDSRIQYLWSHGIVPFISFKITTLPAATNCISSVLNALPSNQKLWIANCHECEADMAAAPYIALQQADWNVVKNATAHTQGRVKFMSIQTRQWTENNQRSYATYWCGCGDYFAVDMYANSWESTYPNPGSFLYQSFTFAQSHGLTVMYPELGAIQFPSDPTDTGRAAWISGLESQFQSTARFVGAIWWDDEGTGGRDFRLHGPSLTAWNAVLAAN